MGIVGGLRKIGDTRAPDPYGDMAESLEAHLSTYITFQNWWL